MKFLRLPSRHSALIPGLALAVLSLAPVSAGEASGNDNKNKPEIAREGDSERAQDRFSRETPEIAGGWSPVLDIARRSTVRLLEAGKPIAFATAVHENGYLLTKSSEVHDSKGKPLDDISAQFPGGITLAVKITDVHSRFDLALLKVEAKGLTPMPWDTKTKPSPGTYLAAVTPERLPAAVGVLSVLSRSLDETTKGFLGIRLEKESESGQLFVRYVGQGSAAFEAGLLKDDVVKSINGKVLNNVSDFIETIAAHKPYDTVKVLIRRGDEEKELSATLRCRPEVDAALTEDARNTMSGPLSRNRRGYPTVFQHDMVLEPNECGGPVVDLDGHVIGLNIARSGRIECFAIPSATLVDLLKKVDTGKFSRPELDNLRKELKNAESLLDQVKKDAERLKTQLREAGGN